MKNNFNWCGYNWHSVMEGGRIIHPSYPWMWYDPNQILLAKGDVLEFFVKYKPAEIHHWDGKTYNPTMACGLIRSEEDFGYGTFSAEMMLPKGRNLWPSFWITGSANWPPEIDIMEAWLDDKGSYFHWFTPQFPWLNPSWKTTTNVHYNNTKLEHEQCGSRNISYCKQNFEPSESFVTYKCVWLPNSITFYANDKEVRKITGKVCEYLTENLEDKDKGWKMNVVFNVLCENPEEYKVDMVQPMLIRNFKYEAL